MKNERYLYYLHLFKKISRIAYNIKRTNNYLRLLAHIFKIKKIFHARRCLKKYSRIARLNIRKIYILKKNEMNLRRYR